MAQELNADETPLRIPIPAVGFQPPVYGIRRAKGPFVLDGNINKPFWEDAPFTEPFQDIEGPSRPIPRFQTRAKMLWDDGALYIAAQLQGDEIWAGVTQRDDVIFHDNDFEVFIDTDSDTQMYYEFEMNALNTVWDLFLPRAYRDGGAPVDSWDIKGLRTAVHIDGELNNPNADNTGWSVEIVMPFRTMMETLRRPEPPKPGDYWRINFSRVQWTVDNIDGKFVKRTGADGKPLPEDNWVWAPTGVVNIHYPELWGFAFFLDEQGKGGCAIPKTERMKWELRRVYYAEHAYFDRHGCFCGDLDTVMQETGLAVAQGIKLECTAHGFEAYCTGSMGETAVIFHDGRTAVISQP